MSTLPFRFNERAVDVKITENAIVLVLADGREISAPLEWFPRLREAKLHDRQHWQLIGHGVGVHWPSIDEDIAVSTLMRGHD